MSVRVTALIISILYIQVKGIQQNGANNLSNLALNKTSVLNSQGNSFQNKINQLPNNLQQSDSLKLAKNLQQAFSLQQATNVQNVNAHQPLNIQQSKLQPSLTGQQANNLQQSVVLQQPVNLQQPTNSIYPNNLQQNLMLQQQQNQNLGNLQTLRQASDVSVLQNAQLSPQFTQSQLLGPNPTSNSAVITSMPTSQANLCNFNTPAETVSLLCPQNQQVPYTGVPYVLDISQVTNTPTTLMSQTSTNMNNQPSIVTFIAPPQQNQQQYIVQNPMIQNPVVQNPTEIPNQITIIKSVQPYSSVQSPVIQDQNQINFVSPGLAQALPTSYTEALPTIESIITSSLTNKASKSSNLKSLLPLIFRLLKERNNCGCNQQCDCKQKTQTPPFGVGDNNEISKLIKYGYHPDLYLNYINDNSEEFDSRESRKNGKKYGKHKNIKQESAEYDYSEEFIED